MQVSTGPHVQDNKFWIWSVRYGEGLGIIKKF